MAPGGSVVACVSIDSPVASLPLKMARACAPASAIGAAVPESAAAGSSKHISRRVIVIVSSSSESSRAQKVLDSEQENLLASLRLSSRKAQTKNERKLHDEPASSMQ